MSSKNDMKLGVFIAAAGLVILLGKLGVFGFLGRALWPLIILVPGLFLHVLFSPAGLLHLYSFQRAYYRCTACSSAYAIPGAGTS